MNGHELATHAGVSYRQLDYWVRKGFIRAAVTRRGRSSPPLDPLSPGSGSTRTFSPGEVEICRRMALLVRIGLRIDIAAEAAREWVHGGRDSAYLGEGVLITLEPACIEQEQAA